GFAERRRTRLLRRRARRRAAAGAVAPREALQEVDQARRNGPRGYPVAVGRRTQVVDVVAAAPVHQAVACSRPVVADVGLHGVLAPPAVDEVDAGEVPVAVTGLSGGGRDLTCNLEPRRWVVAGHDARSRRGR